jgi:hypothetical protein
MVSKFSKYESEFFSKWLFNNFEDSNYKYLFTTNKNIDIDTNFSKYHSFCIISEKDGLTVNEKLILNLDQYFQNFFKKLSECGVDKNKIDYLKALNKNQINIVKNKIKPKDLQPNKKFNILNYIKINNFEDSQRNLYDFLSKIDKKYLTQIYKNSLKLYLLKNQINTKNIEEIIKKIKFGLLEIENSYDLEYNITEDGILFEYQKNESSFNNLLNDYSSYSKALPVLVNYLYQFGFPVIFDEDGVNRIEYINIIKNYTKIGKNNLNLDQLPPKFELGLNKNKKSIVDFYFINQIIKQINKKDKNESQMEIKIKKKIKLDLEKFDKELNLFLNNEKSRNYLININQPAPLFYLIKNNFKSFNDFFEGFK